MVKRAFSKACGRVVDDEDDESEESGSGWVRSVSTAAVPRDPPPATHRFVVRKPVTAGDEELAMNSRARCAKYRIVERLGEEDGRGMGKGKRTTLKRSSASEGGEGGEASAPPALSKYAMKKLAQNSAGPNSQNSPTKPAPKKPQNRSKGLAKDPKSDFRVSDSFLSKIHT